MNDTKIGVRIENFGVRANFDMQAVLLKTKAMR